MATINCSSQKNEAGLSLIELMVAMAIGTFLLLGIVQIFSSSSLAFRTNEANSRVQETGRFAVEFLRRDARMVGHMGCVNDRTHFAPGAPISFRSTFVASGQPLEAAPLPLRFDISIQGYEAAGTQPGGGFPLSATPEVGDASDWLPNLPDEVLALRPVRGSDIVIFRFFAPEAVRNYLESPGDTFSNPDPISGQFEFFTSYAPFPVEAGRVYGLADCLSARVFRLTAGAGVPGMAQVAGGSLNNQQGFQNMGSTTLFREFLPAESLVYYVGIGAGGEPALFRASLPRVLGGGGSLSAAERWVPAELVEGVENLQLTYGTDGLLDSTLDYLTAIGVETAGADVRFNWLQVGSVRAGITVRSAAPALAPVAGVDINNLGVTLAFPAEEIDRPRLRRNYETTIALRNRLRTN